MLKLYHSDIYLGSDFSDGLQHWRYIKREKRRNGTYRYYYSNDKYESAKKANEDAKKASRKANAQYQINNRIANAVYDSITKDGYITDKERKKYDSVNSRLNISSLTNQKAGEQYLATKNKLLMMSIATLPDRLIGAGLAKALTFIDRIKYKAVKAIMK